MICFAYRSLEFVKSITKLPLAKENKSSLEIVCVLIR